MIASIWKKFHTARQEVLHDVILLHQGRLSTKKQGTLQKTTLNNTTLKVDFVYHSHVIHFINKYGG